VGRKVDSDALGTVNRVLNIAGAVVGGGQTELEDDRLIQTLDLTPFVRRGRTVGNLTGWYQGILVNVHSAADGEVSSIDPYSPGASANAPYPGAVPRGWDVWLLGVSGIRSAGAGGLTSAWASINPILSQVGWSQDDAGAPVGAISPRFQLARFTGLDTTQSASGQDAMTTAQGETFVKTTIRIPRGMNIEFFSESAAAATFQMLYVMGLFPEGLGQDVLV